MTAPPLTYDAVELWVGNAKQAAHYFRSALGFELTAYAGPETGVRDRASYVVQQGELRMVLTSGLRSGSPVVTHHARHGDGVRDVAFEVDEVDAVFERALAGGAKPLQAPATERDDHGALRVAAFCAYGDTVHSLVDRRDYHGPFRPGYEATGPDRLASARAPVGLERIDHVVGNVPRGEMTPWSDFYERALGFAPFHHFSDDDISTEHSALMSNVLWDGVGEVKLPINEPAEGPRRSQIDEFLEAYEGPGIQHLALETRDIITTVRRLRERGVGFLEVPREYYARARERVGEVAESWEQLAEQGVLVDRDDDGYLLQLFTEPLADRPTLFLEIIQREGATGFGAGNFQALFEAIERAQARRGNL